MSEDQSEFYTCGVDADEARYGVIMLHGRGSDINDMKSVVPTLNIKKDSYIIIPEAPQEIMPGRYAWYSHFYNEKLDENLQQLSQSFEILDRCIRTLQNEGINMENIILFGHCQGANLLLEYMAANPQPVKAVVILRGCFLGEYSHERDFRDNMPEGTKFIIHSGRRDPYIPAKKIDQTCNILNKLKTTNLHRKQFDAGHGICREELNELKKLFKNDFSVI